MYKILYSPAGVISLSSDGDSIKSLKFGQPPVSAEIADCSLLLEAERQLTEYFSGERKMFDLPLDLEGTSFQLQVWNALLEIPWGKTSTYGEIAAKIDNPKASRAVGMANNKNPVSIIVPCHRVIGKDGSLVGYGGGLDIKRFLLNLETVSE